MPQTGAEASLAKSLGFGEAIRSLPKPGDAHGAGPLLGVSDLGELGATSWAAVAWWSSTGMRSWGCQFNKQYSEV